MNDDALRRGIVDLLPQLRRFAFALTGVREDADDLLQATAERLLERGAPADADLGKWAFRVCKNIWIDEIRARQVRRAAAQSGKLAGDENLDGERLAIERLTVSKVNKAFAELSEDQRAALSLVAVEGLSYAEAAEALGSPIGTVMSRISRARQALAEALSPSLEPVETSLE
ncbi:MAG TPA: sigma-70 family RNA polymerase sigma factor [Parvularculaceae bacterium]|nr:sigma-70 family RNA polymerase sigma factor [Parvularculaceae bacterium]